MDMLLQDLRYALRALRKSPLFSIVAIVTLALGIGANATIYTWLEGIVLRPLPAVTDPDRLVIVNTRGPENVKWSFSIPDWQDVRNDAKLIEGPAIGTGVQLSVRTEGQAERAWGELVSANFFDVLGVRAFLGRGFQAAEDSAPGAHPVIVLSYGYWQRKFAGDPAAVGRSISVNNHPFTVIGVMPPHFGGSIPVLQYDAWVPVTMVGAITGQPQQFTNRHWQSYQAFARLKPGVRLEAAQAEMTTIGRRLAATYREDENTGRDIQPFSEGEVQSLFRPALLAVLGITVVVLLIACANVANLLLARASARGREMAIRLALGARRAQLVRQLLLESLVLSLLGGAGGLVIAAWGSGMLSALLPPVPGPVDLNLHLDLRVFLFALAVTVGTVLLFGIVPALQASRPQLVPALKNGVGSSAHGRGILRGSLVVTQISLSVVALVAAGLFLRSVSNAQRVDTGIKAPEHVLLVATDLFNAGYTPSTGRVMYRQLLERVLALPSVQAVALSGNVPLGFGGHNSSTLSAEGYVPGKDENMSIENDDVSPQYFMTIGLPLLQGREFTAQDDSGAARVVVVNAAFAKKYWPGQDPIGRWIDFGGGRRTVVGLVQTAKRHQLNEVPLPFVYLPLAQDYTAQVVLHVRTAGDPKAFTETLRRAMASMDPNLPFLDPTTLSDYMQASVFFMRIGAIMIGLFGALALALAAIGIYSVIAYSVSQRTRELGIRTALGAARKDILSLVVGEGMLLLAIGAVVGTALAAGVAQLMRSQLLGVGATDPATFVTIVLVLGVVALLASWIPARRASRVDPMVALRSE